MSQVKSSVVRSGFNFPCRYAVIAGEKLLFRTHRFSEAMAAAQGWGEGAEVVKVEVMATVVGEVPVGLLPARMMPGEGVVDDSECECEYQARKEYEAELVTAGH